MSDALDSQAIAADPAITAFVTANAGSGKTTTLVDRVARLLLRGVEPETILCVTYTKAAAAEMQRRLFEQLGALGGDAGRRRWRRAAQAGRATATPDSAACRRPASCSPARWRRPAG